MRRPCRVGDAACPHGVQRRCNRRGCAGVGSRVEIPAQGTHLKECTTQGRASLDPRGSAPRPPKARIVFLSPGRARCPPPKKTECRTPLLRAAWRVGFVRSVERGELRRSSRLSQGAAALRSRVSALPPAAAYPGGSPLAVGAPRAPDGVRARRVVAESCGRSIQRPVPPLWRRMRALLPLVLAGFLVIACDPVAGAGVGIAIAPRPSAAPDSVSQVAFALAARISMRHGVPAIDPRQTGEEGWGTCFERGKFYLCGKQVGSETQFHSWQWGLFFSPLADSVRRELLDSLRTEFGPSNVRTCNWQSVGNLRSKASGVCRSKPVRDGT